MMSTSGSIRRKISASSRKTLTKASMVAWRLTRPKRAACARWVAVAKSAPLAMNACRIDSSVDRDGLRRARAEQRDRQRAESHGVTRAASMLV